LLYLVVVLGSIVRATGSGLGCPDWPLCNGALIPPARFEAMVEFSHRLAAALASPAVLATAWLGWRQRRARPALAWLAALGVGLLILQVLLGALTVRWELPPAIVAVHLSVALLLLGLEAGIATSLAAERRAERRGRISAAYLATLLAVFVVLVSGAWVSAGGAKFACSGWPLCSGTLLPEHALGKIHLLHRILVLGTSLLVLTAAWGSWKARATEPATAVAMSLSASLFLAQAATGAVGVVRGFPADLAGLHVVTGAAVWASLVIAFTISGAAVAEGRGVVRARRPIRARDLVALTKPWIVGLLLVTTLAGMIVGRGAWPGGGLVGWTLLGGALSAGGASALNQVLDRKQDSLMTRTRRRPLPSGSVSPAEAMAFGLACCVAGFYILALAVNLLSAVLALGGMLYYVLLYSMVLKPSTPQNIVVGGGAGAIPPLVGWAAATGRLEWSSLFLFALVFFWTPAHFWALALVRQQDYARAGVPMLPVVYGERETRRHILLYSLQVVALTLLIPVARLGGLIYLAAAVGLGGWLIARAWNLWKVGGKKAAWGLYRYSSVYLALLLAALVADTLLRT
jgi:protoheme IX farnesyltransferase